MADAEVASPPSETEIASWVVAAGEGDADAWDRLVDRFAKLVWAVARGHGLSEADAADVSQTSWLRLAENLHRLRQPGRVGAWLAATARNESLRQLRRGRRLMPAELDDDLPRGEQEPPDRRLLQQEQDAELWRAFRTLSSPCQTLLRTLMAEPEPSYAEVSAALGMPVGSIGPRRQRCLKHLRSCTHLGDELPTDDGRTGA